MTDVLYAARATNQTTSDLYTVDPATGVTTSVGPIGFAVTGLAWDPVGLVMYGATSPNSASNPKKLISIDLTTGAGTVIGAFGGGSPRAMGDLACDSAGNLFGWYVSGSLPIGLYSIDKATGVASSIGGVAPAASGGIAFDSGDVLWFLLFDSATVAAQIYTVDPVTGIATAGAFMSGYSVPGGSGVFNAAAVGPGDVLYGSDNWKNATPPTVSLVTVTTPGAVTALASVFDITGVDSIAWAPGSLSSPTITSFSPPGGHIGATVTITGTSLTGASSVTFNGTAAISYTVDSATQITATVPVGATTGRIEVTTPGGTATSSSDFIVDAPTAIEYVRVYGFQIRLGDDGVETVDRLITSPDGF